MNTKKEKKDIIVKVNRCEGVKSSSSHQKSLLVGNKMTFSLIHIHLLLHTKNYINI